MASKFSGARQFLERKAQQKTENNSIDSLVKRAQLGELGYNVQEKPAMLGGLFGGGQTIARDPGFVSTAALQRKKLEQELDPMYEVNKAIAKEKGIMGARKAMYGPMLGGGGGQSDSMYIMGPDGKPTKNPAFVKPLNPLQQAQLEDRNRKREAELQVEENQQDALRRSSQDTLKTIEEVKKGKKYFGPMGNTPSIVAPSTFASFGMDYGSRKNWEANVNKLLSQKVLDVISAMKQQSKTGATGFGAMNEKELKILQDASTALNKELNPDDAMRYLEEIETIHRKFLGGRRGTDEGGEDPDNDISEEDIQFTMNKYGLSREEVLKQLGQ